MYEVEGTIKVILDEQTFASGFSKRDFVVTTEEKYPQDIKLECIKDKIALLEGYAEGGRVKVSFNLRGNEHNGRYFVNLQAWKIENMDSAAAAGESGGAASGDKPPMHDDSFAPADDENLPF